MKSYKKIKTVRRKSKKKLSFFSPPVLLTIFLLVSLVALVYVVHINTNFLGLAKNDQDPGFTVEQARDLGLYKLKPNEFAVIKRPIKNGSADKNVRQSVTLSTGQEYIYEGSDSVEIEIIEGSTTGNQFINLSPTIQILSYDDLDDKSGKIDTGIERKLAKQENVPVLIQFKVPFEKFYEKNQSADKRLQKEQQYESAKQRVVNIIGANGKAKKDLKIINAIAADINKSALEKLEKNDLITKVELDRDISIDIDTSVAQIEAPAVWNYFDTTGSPMTGAGIVVGVIDTGVDYKHSDLGGCIGPECKVIGGYDCYNNDNDPMDDQGHGTHVAATIAGKGSVGTQNLWGVAPDAKIRAYKVLGSGGSGTTSQVICGIDRATADGVQVANMSLGGSGTADDLGSQAVDRSSAAGVAHAISAGNSGPTASTVGSPGLARTAITVAAACKPSQYGIDSSCATPIASFSSRGPEFDSNNVDLRKPDISAPGRLICAALTPANSSWTGYCFDNRHVRISGTSMASPHIAGAIALVRQAYPNMQPAEIKALLKASATDQNIVNGVKQYNLTYNDQGAGLVNLKRAIPGEQNVSVSPQSWEVLSDKTTQMSTKTQVFQISPLISGLDQLTVGVNQSKPGITVEFNKPIINATDSLQVTVTIDNNVAVVGAYSFGVTLSNANGIKGVIPLFVTVQPTLESTPYSLDFGLDNPVVTTWTSPTRTITLTNTRSDIDLMLPVSMKDMAGDIVLNAPATITVPKSSSVDLTTSLTVNNANLTNGLYNGTIVVGNSIAIPIKFLKSYAIEVSSSDSTDIIGSSIHVIRSTSSSHSVTSILARTNPVLIPVSSLGNYDLNIKINKQDRNGPSSNSQYTILKENIAVTTGYAQVSLSASEAKNLVVFKGTDINGNPIVPKSLHFMLRNEATGLSVYIGLSTGGPDTWNRYFSDISSNYLHQYQYLVPQTPTNYNPFYFFTESLTNLSSSKTFTNSPTDFRSLQIQGNAELPNETRYPMHHICTNPLTSLNGQVRSFNCSGHGNSLYGFTSPYVQTYYTIAPLDYSYYQESNVSNVTQQTPYFLIDGTGRRKIYPYSSYDLPNITGGRQYNGLGPVHFSVQFTNSKTNIILRPYGISWMPLSAFKQQDFSLMNYPALPVQIVKDTGEVTSTTLPSYSKSGSMTNYPNVLLIPTTSAGKYTLSLNLPYINNGVNLNGKVSTTFDTNLTDPNPPALKRMYFYANNRRSEVYDPTVPNRLEIDADAVGGTLTTVLGEYSTDGTSFTELAQSISVSAYIYDLPSINNSEKLTVRLTLIDSNNNSLQYSFEIPKGTAPVDQPQVTPVPTSSVPTSTVAPTVTQLPTATIAPTSTPRPTLTPTSVLVPTNTPVIPLDTIAPSVQITVPTNGSVITRNSTITINAEAIDNFGGSGIARVDFYVNNSLKCSDTFSAYTCTTKISGRSGASYLLEARGFDKAGNVSSSKVTITSK